MIVLDENLHDPLLIGAIAAWYPGQVVSLTALRPDSLIKDEAVPTLLLRATQPTFLTINVNDFWKKSAPHRSYCLVLVDLPAARVQETAIFLRRLLQFPRFRTKAMRMQTVVRLTPGKIEYYGADRQIHVLSWQLT